MSYAVTFTPDRAGAHAWHLRPLGEMSWSVGMRPDAWQFAAAWPDVVTLGDNPGEVSGTLRLIYNGATEATLADIGIVDLRVMTTGRRTAEDTDSRPVEYRITLADCRRRLTSPRGGALNSGAVNTAPINLTTNLDAAGRAVKTNLQILQAVVSEMPVAVDLVDVPDLPRLMNLDWRGEHAPGELERLLDGLGMVLYPMPDGTCRVEPSTRLGSSFVYEPPPERRKSVATFPLIPRAGGKVLITSAPVPSVDTIDVEGFGPDGWEYVVQVQDDQWEPLDHPEVTLLLGEPPEDALSNGFKRVPVGPRERMKLQLFRCVRLRLDNRPHDRILQQQITYAGELKPIHATATRLVFDEEDGLWHQSRGVVGTRITLVDNGRVLQFEERLVRPRGEDRQSPRVDNKTFVERTGGLLGDEPDEFKVRITVERRNADGPIYAEFGFRLNGVQVQSIDVDDARKHGAIIRRPELYDRRWNGAEIEVGNLEARARLLAGYVLGESVGPAAENVAAGFLGFRLSGRTHEISASFSPPATTYRITTGTLPSSPAGLYLRLREKGVLRAGSGVVDRQLDRLGTDSYERPVVEVSGISSPAPSGSPHTWLQITEKHATLRWYQAKRLGENRPLDPNTQPAEGLFDGAECWAVNISEMDRGIDSQRSSHAMLSAKLPGWFAGTAEDGKPVYYVSFDHTPYRNFRMTTREGKLYFQGTRMQEAQVAGDWIDLIEFDGPCNEGGGS